MRESERHAFAVEMLKDYHDGRSDLFDDDLLLRLSLLRDDERRLELFLGHTQKVIDRYHFFQNGTYEVLVSDAKVPKDWPAMCWLSIKRIDRKSIHDWGELQKIKNAIVGPEHEAVELYPAETRRVDMATEYLLYVFIDPQMRMPFGFQGRSDREGMRGRTGQRPGGCSNN